MSSGPSFELTRPVFGHGYHPFKEWELVQGMDVLAITVPRAVLVKGATALIMFQEKNPVSTQILSLLRLLLHLANQNAHEFKNGERQPNFVALLERIRHRTNGDTDDEGYRLLFYYKASGWYPGKDMDKLIQDNADEIKRQDEDPFLKRDRFVRNPDRLPDLMSREKLVEWATTKNAVAYQKLMHKIKSLTFDHPDNPLRPERLFGLDFAMHCSEYADADQMSIANYRYYDQYNVKCYKAPYENCLYRLKQSQLRAHDFLRFELPKPGIGKNLSGLAYDTFALLHKGKTAEVELQPVEAGAELPEDKKTETLFEAAVGSPVDASEPVNWKQLHKRNMAERDRITGRIQELKHEKKLTENEIQMEHRRLKDNFMKRAFAEFRDVWNEFAPTSPTIRKIIQWGSEYLQKHGTFFQLIPKLSSNLSYWLDHLVQRAHNLEMVTKASTSHGLITVLLWAFYNASDPDRKNKLHAIMSGDAAVSKSFGLDTIANFFAIPNSYDTWTYTSSRADANSGDGDESAEFWHETDYSALGVATGTTNNAKAVRTPEEAAWKAEMTSGELTAKVLRIDKQTGKRETEYIMRYKNHVKLCATNAGLHQISPEIKSRFHPIVVPDRRRPGKDIIDVICDVESAAFKKLKHDVIEGYRREHYLVVLTHYLIKCGILLPVTTEYSHRLYSRVLNAAAKAGVPNTRQPRSLARLLCAVRCNVVLRANLIHFSSPLSIYNPANNHLYKEVVRESTRLATLSSDDWKQLSPAERQNKANEKADEAARLADNSKWDDRWMATLEPQLVDDDPSIAVAVLGMMDSEYYNKTQYHVLQALKNRFLWVSEAEMSMSEHETAEDARAHSEAQRRAYLALQMAKEQDGFSMDTKDDEYQRPAGTEAAPPLPGTARFKANESSDPETRKRQLEGRRSKRLGYPERQDAPQYHVKGLFNIFSEDTTGSKVHQLCHMLLPYMDPAPRYQDVYQALFELMRLKVEYTVEDTAERNEINALEFHGNGLLIAVDTIENNNVDKMRDAVKSCLEYRHTVPARFLYGMDAENPYLFQWFDVQPNDKDVEMVNLNYYHPHMRNMLQATLPRNPSNFGRVKAMFDSASSVVANMPIEEYAFRKRATECGWTMDKLKMHGVFSERVLFRKLVAQSGEELANWQTRLRKMISSGDVLNSTEAEQHLGPCPKDDDGTWLAQKVALTQQGQVFTEDQAIAILGDQPIHIQPYPDSILAFNKARDDRTSEMQQNLEQQQQQQQQAMDQTENGPKFLSDKMQEFTNALGISEDDDDYGIKLGIPVQVSRSKRARESDKEGEPSKRRKTGVDSHDLREAKQSPAVYRQPEPAKFAFPNLMAAASSSPADWL